MHDPKAIHTMREARSEAVSRFRDNNTCNAGMEWAFSPSTFAVGMRWTDLGYETLPPFRVPNVFYPMYGHSEKVTDWHSVGVTTFQK